MGRDGTPGRGPARASQKFWLINNTYVIIYLDGQSPSMKIGGIDRDLVVVDKSKDREIGSRVLVEVTERPNAKAPLVRGNDVDVAALMRLAGMEVVRNRGLGDTTGSL